MTQLMGAVQNFIVSAMVIGVIYSILDTICFYITRWENSLARWNRNQDRKMLEDFPHDPWIQEKYSRRIR